MRTAIGAIKLFIFFLSGLFTIGYQSLIMFFTKGELALVYPRLYHGFVCRLLGLKIEVEGTIETGRNIVYMGNHLSYMDIQALGSLVKGSFIAKKEVRSWPFIGLLGSMGRTLYVSRDPKDAKHETQRLMDRLEEGLPLIIFPEGTSSNGSSILPFKSTYFEVFLNKNIRIQPFTISLMRVNGATVDHAAIRDDYAWYGDMDFAPHLWKFIKGRGAVLKITFQKPIVSAFYNDRKMLCKDVYESVCKGLDLSVDQQYCHTPETTFRPQERICK